ncbi:MAG: aminoglycoside N(3)-acetyltransferase [Anaerolineae bacterium]
MSEAAAVTQTQTGPVTVQRLEADLTALGITAGMTLLVHSSLRAIGWVCGGPVAVVLALQNLLGAQGTLVMPTHSAGLSDPAQWQNPPVPESWWATIRQTMPPFDPDLTPTRKMGAIAECFRKQRDARRSNHPQFSFAARGPHAAAITQTHSLHFGLGEDSPLARLYDLDARVLLLGVGHANNTSLHLAEYRAGYSVQKIVTNGAPVLEKGRRRWVTVQDLPLNDDDFTQIGADFARQTGLERRGQVGLAPARLFPQRALVDFAARWMAEHRRE